MARINKTKSVKEHLISNGSITSWDAIKKFKATRLSAIIFNLKKKGMNILSKGLIGKDGIRYVQYFYMPRKK